MTLDVVNETKVREIHLAPIFPDTFIYIRRKMGFAIVEQNDEIVDVVKDDEYIDNLIAQIKQFNPILVVR